MRDVLVPVVTHFIRLIEHHSTSDAAKPQAPARMIVISTTVVVEREKEKAS